MTGEARLQLGLQQAKREYRRVLIQWGSGGSPWSRALEHQLRTDGIAARVRLYYCEFVPFDVDKEPDVAKLASRYRVELRPEMLPLVTILDGDGRVLATSRTSDFRWSDKAEDGYDAEKVADWVLKYKPECPAAQAVFEQALKDALFSNRQIFLHIGAPYCGPCRRLDAWLALPEVSAIISKDFIDLEIDLERMAGGKDIWKRFCQKPSGIPWFGFLDSKGKVIVDCVAPNGAIGFPTEPGEIQYFVSMVPKARRSIPDAEVQRLKSLLEQSANGTPSQ